MRTRWPWRLWVGMWVFVGVDAVTAFAAGCVAALSGSQRLWMLEIPLLLGGMTVAAVAGIWADERGAPVPPRRMSRDDRRAFLRRESELERESQIRARELELGIREADGDVVATEYLPVPVARPRSGERGRGW